jgi:DNA-binding response OmpR family regulator
MKLLLIEDNASLAHWLASLLRQQDFIVDSGRRRGGRPAAAPAALRPAAGPEPAGLSGKGVLRRLRERGALPVLMLTPRRAGPEGAVPGDRRRRLPGQADRGRELVARIKALVRRLVPGRANTLLCGDLGYDLQTRQFTLAGAPLPLPPRERALLEALMLKQGSTVPKQALLDGLFDLDDEAGVDALELYVHRLRKLDASQATIITCAASATCCACARAFDLHVFQPAPSPGGLVAAAALAVRRRLRLAQLAQRGRHGRLRAGPRPAGLGQGAVGPPDLGRRRRAASVPPAALALFASPAHDQVFLSVTAADGRPLAGCPAFRCRRGACCRPDRAQWYDARIEGRPVRAVLTERAMYDVAGAQAITIAVAKTTGSRDQMVRTLWWPTVEYLLAALALALVLTPLALTWELRPVMRLGRQLARRDPLHLDFAVDARSLHSELRPVGETINQFVREPRRTRGAAALHRRRGAPAAHAAGAAGLADRVRAPRARAPPTGTTAAPTWTRSGARCRPATGAGRGHQQAAAAGPGRARRRPGPAGAGRPGGGGAALSSSWPRWPTAAASTWGWTRRTRARPGCGPNPRCWMR